MSYLPISLISTVFNEASSVGRLLESILGQTRPPDEVVVVDGGSHDHTVEVLRAYERRLPLRVLVEPGANISRGRNMAVQAAHYAHIAATDAGVRLEPTWLEELIKPWTQAPPDVHPDVISGFFTPDIHTPLEAAMGATVLPALEDIDPQTFLPSSRSLAFTKEAWQRVGGYPEWLDYCEDLVYDLRLRRAGCRFAWAPKAIVHFHPRSRLMAFFRQYYHYARGDGKADLWFRRHLIRYVSYAAAPALLTAGFWFPLAWAALALGFGLHLYRPYQRLLPLLRGWPWSAKAQACLFVPMIRVTGDVAKMVGYPVGVVWRKKHGHPRW